MAEAIDRMVITETTPILTQEGREMFRQYVIAPGLGFDGEGGVLVQYVSDEHLQD